MSTARSIQGTRQRRNQQDRNHRSTAQRKSDRRAQNHRGALRPLRDRATGSPPQWPIVLRQCARIPRAKSLHSTWTKSILIQSTITTRSHRSYRCPPTRSIPSGGPIALSPLSIAICSPLQLTSPRAENERPAVAAVSTARAPFCGRAVRAGQLARAQATRLWFSLSLRFKSAHDSGPRRHSKAENQDLPPCAALTSVAIFAHSHSYGR